MRKAIFAAAIMLSATHAWADEVTETACDVLATGADGKVHTITACDVLATGADGKVHTILERTKVLEPTRSATTFSIAIPEGYSDASVR